MIVVGVIDGRVLYDTLADKMHPLGATYTQVYDFLNCIGISPCWGWSETSTQMVKCFYSSATDISLTDLILFSFRCVTLSSLDQDEFKFDDS